MQLPTSSTPTDSNPLAAIFPGLTPTGVKCPPGLTARNGDAKFDQVFDGLASSAAPTSSAAPATVDPATLAAGVTAVFVPPAPVGCPGIPGVISTEIGGDQNASDTAAGEPDVCALPLPGDVALSGFSTGEAKTKGAPLSERPSPNSCGRRGDERSGGIDATATVIADVSAGTVAGDAATSIDAKDVHQPNEQASEKAFNIPRFTGLPAAALEHRKAPNLPPGIARLMARHAPAPTMTGDNDTTEPTTDATSSTFPTTSSETADSADDAEIDSVSTEPASTATSTQTNDTTTVATGAALASAAECAFEPEPVAANADVSPSTDAVSELISDASTRDTPTSDVASQATLSGSAGQSDFPAATDSVQVDHSDAEPATEVGATVQAQSYWSVSKPFVKTQPADREHAGFGWGVGRAKHVSPESDSDSDPAPALPPGIEKVVREILPNTANASAQVALERSPALATAASEANFAAADRANGRSESVRQNGAKKSFVATEDEDVTPQRKTLGIGVAKTTPTMFARFLPTPLQHAATEFSVAGVAALKGSEESASAASKEASAPQPVSSAHQAVEVVLKTADQISTQAQKSVNLRFSVGDTDLSVRVELHADEVRATFRTDSPELRAALSQEWQSLNPTSGGDRVLRIAPAVFTSSDQSALNASAGDTSSRQRNPHASQRDDDRGAFSIRGAGRAAVATVASPSSAISSSASRTSRHLQTVA